MVGIDIQHGPAIEQLPINDVKIRAIGAEELVFSGLGIGTVKMNFHLNVVEDTQRVVDGVVADGINGHLADADTTHDAIHADESTWS